MMSEMDAQMMGGCCVCGGLEAMGNDPLVYCDGEGCMMGVHKGCYGISKIPTGSWFCRVCEVIKDPVAKANLRCVLCPNKDGALKKTESGEWAHVVCVNNIPVLSFKNEWTLEGIDTSVIPISPERFNKACGICEENGMPKDHAISGVLMDCNKEGCEISFHVTCAQAKGLLCEAGDKVKIIKYFGYCQQHLDKLKRKGSERLKFKIYPAFTPIPGSSEPDKSSLASRVFSNKKSTKRLGKFTYVVAKRGVGVRASCNPTSTTASKFKSGLGKSSKKNLGDKVKQSAESGFTSSGTNVIEATELPPVLSPIHTSSSLVASMSGNFFKPTSSLVKQLFQTLTEDQIEETVASALLTYSLMANANTASEFTNQMPGTSTQFPTTGHSSAAGTSASAAPPTFKDFILSRLRWYMGGERFLFDQVGSMDIPDLLAVLDHFKNGNKELEEKVANLSVRLEELKVLNKNLGGP